MKKNKIAALAIAGALSLGTISGVTTAQADPGHAVGGAEAAVTSVLASLVTKGTITQAQSDAITAALKAAVPAPGAIKPGKDGMGIGGIGANTAARQAIVTSFLGKTAEEVQTARKAGKSLATIATDAGKVPADLIAALVRYDNAQIDAAVTAGTLTAANATTIKANVTAMVTKEVNNVGGPKGLQSPKGGKGPKGHGPDGDDDRGTSANGATGGTLVTPGTSTNGASSKSPPKKTVKKVVTVSKKKANA
jgi:hypothetical protein